MNLTVTSFANATRIPAEYAFCIPADEGHVTFAPNRNPHVGWTPGPEGTKSYALIMVDPDVPSVGDDVNQEGKTVPADLPRVDFYHWVLVNIPADVHIINEGEICSGVTPRGKTPGPSKYGLRGINSYTSWFAGDPDMEGEYGGYDGPCPPWNDELVHRYFIRVYALDVVMLNLSGSFTGDKAVAAMQGHILEMAEWMGTYTLNPAKL